uniref:SUEL-type lectin domain-containing protein n=1 Tax=Poecilia latipinna TaxID=48699 RepID=A0A3B3V6H7_9TELE
ISLVTCEGSVSHIRAIYGRTDHTTCSDGIPDDQTRKTDCATRADLVCDGESECPFVASSSVLGDPCVGTFKYLEVKYVCESEFIEKSLVACEGAVARLHCEGQAIYVTSASYGRTNKKTCSAGRPADQLENTECYTYREEVGERCNGKQWCKVRASNYVFGNPCYGTYKYLEVEYICYGEFRLSLH